MIKILSLYGIVATILLVSVSLDAKADQVCTTYTNQSTGQTIVYCTGDNYGY